METNDQGKLDAADAVWPDIYAGIVEEMVLFKENGLLIICMDHGLDPSVTMSIVQERDDEKSGENET